MRFFVIVSCLLPFVVSLPAIGQRSGSLSLLDVAGHQGKECDPTDPDCDSDAVAARGCPVSINFYSFPDKLQSLGLSLFDVAGHVGKLPCDPTDCDAVAAGSLGLSFLDVAGHKGKECDPTDDPDCDAVV
ncbi:hypothetical protein B0H16DRAFT_1713113 [Mycena metata]|uniref:Uncharacterized protein n=1 Tax=Mycena metata TaxID=1033252 RepID=A0AAD7K2F3_9AGAR|nr:hypothetical protein B0H16DRAFT_1713113 [Mycena metata]